MSSPSASVPDSAAPSSSDLLSVDFDSSELQAELDEDAEIEEVKRRIEEEERKLAALTSSASPSVPKPSAPLSQADQSELDGRSVYVGQVDYSATADELKELFSACGAVNRVTILVDKHTGHPKGFAYVEFKDVDSVSNACLLNETEFKGRALKVTPKRTNVPSFQRSRGRGGFRGGRGAPRGRGAPFFRGRGGGAAFKNQKAVYTPY
jgi:polyadenylate-binding protein 2